MSADRRPAGLGRRIGAYVVDIVIAYLIIGIVGGVVAGISLATSGGVPPFVAGIAAALAGIGWFFVYTAMQGAAGSLGMRMTGLRLACIEDDLPLGFASALVRNVVWGLGAAVVVGYFSPLFDSSPWRRGWHDRVAGALMTDIAGHGAPAPAPTPAPAGGPEPAPKEIAEPDAADATPAATPAPAAFAPATAGGPTVLPPAPILPQVVPDEPWAREARPAPAAGGVISFVPGVSDAAAPATPAPAAAAVAPASVDDTRIATGDRPVARLKWDDGTGQAVYGRTLFGRNPTPESDAAVTAVRDETLSLSKTHFELTVDDGVLWVVDRHSTNGVVLRRGAARQQAMPGERLRVRAGDILEFGDRHVMIEVAP